MVLKVLSHLKMNNYYQLDIDMAILNIINLKKTFYLKYIHLILNLIFKIKLFFYKKHLQ